MKSQKNSPYPHVTPLHLAKKLAGLGVRKTPMLTYAMAGKKYILLVNQTGMSPDPIEPAAYTASELNEMIGWKRVSNIEQSIDGQWHFLNFHNNHFGYFNTECEARAAYLIECLERGIISASEINNE